MCLNNAPPPTRPSLPQRHTDIFDLVSGMQQEALKEEKLVREKRREWKEKKVARERQKRREWEREVDRGKEKDDEVRCRRGGSGFEFHSQRRGAGSSKV